METNYEFDGKSLMVLRNENRSLIALFTEMEDSSFIAIDRSEFDSEKQEYFLLDNGQEDEYHISKTLRNETAETVVEFFLATGEMYPNVSWENQLGEMQ
jgi:hypothetical protein